MYQSKKSGASTFNLTIFVLAFLIGLVAQVSAHGLVLSPPMRFINGDDYEKVKAASDPTMEHPCGASGYGPVTKYKPGGSMYFAYNVSITHPGPCVVQFNKHGEKEEDFYTIKELGECGKYNGLVTSFVDLPDEPCNGCTIRFMWNDDLGNNYLNCANIQLATEHDDGCMRKRRKSRRSLKF